MPKKFDDPISDLKYIIRRFKKYILKTEYWKTLEELSDAEIELIALYNRRVHDFTDELDQEFTSDYVKRDEYRGGFGVASIYDFADDPDILTSKIDGFEELWSEVQRLKRKAESIRGDYTQSKLKEKHNPKRGNTLLDDDHRAHKNRRLSKRLECSVDELMLAAVEQDIEDSGLSKSDWLRAAIRGHLSVRNRRLLYDTVK